MLSIFSRINPLTYGIDALKHMVFAEKTLLTHDFPLLLDLSVIVAAAAVFVFLGAMVFERNK